MHEHGCMTQEEEEEEEGKGSLIFQLATSRKRKGRLPLPNTLFFSSFGGRECAREVVLCGRVAQQSKAEHLPPFVRLCLVLSSCSFVFLPGRSVALKEMLYLREQNVIHSAGSFCN